MKREKKKVDPLDKLIASNVIRLREARGWNQGALAFHYRCEQPFIAQLENGARGFGPGARARLAEVFGINVEELWATPSPSPEHPAEGQGALSPESAL